MSKTSYSLGLTGELLACNYLISKGYKILHRRYRTKKGEIDIIATNNTNICFIEVKYRKKPDDFEDILQKKQSIRIYETSQDYLLLNPEFSDLSSCFEILFIQQDKSISHLQNIFL
jgi:putative endonuclease